MFFRCLPGPFILLAGLAAAVPAFAAGENKSGSLTQPPASSGQTETLSEARRIVENAADVVRTMKSDAKLSRLLARSRGVLIVPDIAEGASGFGETGSDGVLLSRENGRWSDPAFFELRSVGIGAPRGGLEGPAAMILMSEDALRDFAGNTTLSLGPAAGFKIIGYSEVAESEAGGNDVIVWSEKAPAFTAATLSAPNISVEEDKNRAYYGRVATPQEILRGDVENPHQTTLQNELPG